MALAVNLIRWRVQDEFCGIGGVLWTPIVTPAAGGRNASAEVPVPVCTAPTVRCWEYTASVVHLHTRILHPPARRVWRHMHGSVAVGMTMYHALFREVFMM